MQRLIEEYETLKLKLDRAEYMSEEDAIEIIKTRLALIEHEMYDMFGNRALQDHLRLAEYEDLSHER